MDIVLEPQPCTPEVMSFLEEKGVLTRLMPGQHLLKVEEGESKHASIYETNDRFGPHKLICVTINSTQPKNFLYHNDAEDFMLIDHPDAEDLILTMSLVKHDVLEEKIANGTVSNKDFLAMICNKNDPYTSFFTMHKGFPHVETVLHTSKHPPSFYVGESRDLDENLIDFKEFRLVIRE